MKALMLLYGLQCRSTARKLIRSFKTVKGALTALFFIGIGSMMFVPLIVSVFQPDEVPRFDAERYVPLGMFAYFIYSMLSSISDRALYFTPAEVDHFFPAPFHRKELLAFKIFNWFVLAIFLGALFVCFVGIHLNNMLYGFVGLVVAMFALTMSDMFVSVLGQYLSTHFYSNARKIVAVIALILVAIGVSQTLVQSGATGVADFQTMVDRVNASPTAKVALAPFVAFSNLLFADSFQEFVTWFGVTSAITVGLIAGIMFIDANYLESADRISKKTFANVQRMQAGKSKVSAKANRWRLGMFPFWGGLGPIAWRQLTEAIRKSRLIIIVAALAGVAFFIPVLLNVKAEVLEHPGVVGGAYGALLYLMFIVSMTLQSGFRADIDHIEVFKSLPLSPFCIASGELVGGVAMFGSMFAVVGTMGALATQNFLDLWIGGFLLAVPVLIIHLGLINTLFLFFPVRVGKGSKGIEQMGQGFMTMMFMGIAYGAFGIVVGVPAGIVYWLTENLYICFAVLMFALWLLAVATVYVLGWTYSKFDVAKIPG